MQKPRWTTVSIPTSLYDEIRTRYIPERAPSVQAYVHFWVRVGALIDRALAETEDQESLTERILQSLKALDRDVATENRS